MKRFTAGLLLGSASAGIAYACGASPLWTGLVGAALNRPPSAPPQANCGGAHHQGENA